MHQWILEETFSFWILISIYTDKLTKKTKKNPKSQ